MAAAQASIAWSAGRLIAALASGLSEEAFRPAAFAFAASLFKIGASVLVVHGEVSLARRCGDELRDRVLRSLLAGQRRQGVDDVFRILASLREIEQAIAVGGLGALRAVVSLIPMLALGIVLLPRMVLAGVGVLLPFGIALALIRRAIVRDEREALRLTAALDVQLDTLVRHADLWRVVGTGERVRSWVRALGLQAMAASVAARARRAALSASNEALGALGVLLLVLASSRGWLGQDRASLAVFVALLALSYRPLRDWGDAQGAWLAGGVAFEWLAPWLTAPGEGPAAAASGLLWPLRGLRVERFGAARMAGRWSFSLEPGALALIVGPNGSGKTTLLRSLLGLDEAEGELFYGDQPLRGAGVGPGQRPFAWCPQEAPVLSASLAENVALGRPGAEAEAAEALGPRWSQGLDGAPLGDGGRALSGGERAWVSLARACAGGAPVLLLDEPTASLDGEAEARVIEALRALRGRRTVLVVTHRPERWGEVDVILSP